MLRRLLIAFLIAAAGLVAGCGGDNPGVEQSPQEGNAMSITVTSPAFGDGETIPPEFTCDGDDISPRLDLSGVPSGVVELALLMEDPDARGTFVHWVLWGIGPTVTSLPDGNLPDGVVEGGTSFGRTGYGGPCPPPGDPHRYIFTLFALSEPLDLGAGASAGELRAAMAGTIVAEGSLTGLYGR